jgi:acylphosphatase
MAKTKAARKFVIHGRVQGVGFRFFAERVATQLGLAGYVKNCWDETVEAYAIGKPASLDEFKRHLAQGPRSARVTRVEEAEVEIDDRYSRFVVEDSW